MPDASAPAALTPALMSPSVPALPAAASQRKESVMSEIEIGSGHYLATLRIQPLRGDHAGLCIFDALAHDRRVHTNITPEQAEQIRDALNAFLAGLWVGAWD